MEVVSGTMDRKRMPSLVFALVIATAISIGGAKTTKTDNGFMYPIYPLGDPVVRSVTIWTENELENLPTIDFLEEKPGDAPNPSLPVSSYFRIENGIQVKEAAIEFKVSQTWLDQKRVLENDVVLLRLDVGWTELPTTLTETSDNTFVYQASSSSLSLFAVAGRAQLEQVALLPVSLLILGIGLASAVYWFIVRPRKLFVPLRKLDKDTRVEVVRAKKRISKSGSREIKTAGAAAVKDEEIIKALKNKTRGED